MAKKNSLDNIGDEIKKERLEVRNIEKEIDRLEKKLLDKAPEHFSRRDVIAAFFGSLIIGLTFILKGSTLKIASELDNIHIISIVAFTIAVLVMEIYYVAYVRVKDKRKRPLGQFMAKRFFTLYFIAIFASALLIYMLGIDQQAETMVDIARVIILMSMPCSIGAAIPTLLKKY